MIAEIAGRVQIWVLIFALLFLGSSIIVFIGGWLSDRGRKRKWEERCKQLEQEMIEREKIERSKWTQKDWDRETTYRQGGQTKK